MKIKPIIIISSFSLICILIFIGLYFFQFNGKLSSNSLDWVNFASYFSGVLMPTLTLINIGIFIWLTLTIQKLGEKQKSKELEYQRKLILSQLRQSELDKFELKLNVFNTDFERIRDACYDAKTYLISFKLGKAMLFSKYGEDFLESPLIDYDYLIELLLEIISFCDSGIKTTEEIGSTTQVNYNAMYTLSVSKIQQFIIDDMSQE